MTQRARSAEARKEVQTLVRGLLVLEALNSRPGLSTADVSAACKLPRTTTHRLLKTLAEYGFARRDEASRRYRPSARVLSLSAGFDHADLLTERATAALNAASRQISWPMHFSMRDALWMRIRSSTDLASPLSVHKVLPGMRIPLLQCASGLAWLGAQPDEERARIVEKAISGPGDVQWTRDQLDGELDLVRSRGYALFRRPQRLTSMVGLSVAVPVDGVGTAALCVRFAESAIPVRTATERFLPALREIAAQLAGAR